MHMDNSVVIVEWDRRRHRRDSDGKNKIKAKKRNWENPRWLLM